MLASGIRCLVRAAAGALAAGLLFVSIVTSNAQAATVDEFLANPTQVMAQYPNGGAELISLIRDVATSHPEALQTIVGLLASGSVDQQLAVGSGLGQAYKIVLSTDQNYATQIAAAIGNSNSDSAKTAYSGATGETTISSTGPAGAGAGAGGGGDGGAGGGSGGSTGAGGTQSGGSNSGAGGTTGQSSSQTSSQTFTGGGGGVSGTTSTGISGSVSAR